MGGGAVFGQVTEEGQFGEFFVSKGEPGFDFGIERGFEAEGDGAVKEGAGGGEPKFALRVGGAEVADGGEGGGEVGFPDVAAVDEAEGEDAAGGEAAGEGFDLGGGADGVVVEGVAVEGAGEVEVVPEFAEVGGEEDAEVRDVVFEGGAGAGEEIFLLVGEVEGEDGFVNLHPGGAPLFEAAEDFQVNGEEAVEEVEAIEVGVGGVVDFAEGEVGDGSEEDGFGGEVEGAGLVEVADELGGGEAEGGVGGELGNDVVVVGVEPFGHLAGWSGGVVGGAAGTRGGTAGNEEALRETGVLAVPVEARGDVAEHAGGVEDMVVEGKIAAGDEVDAGLELAEPVGAAEVGAGLFQFLEAEAALPVGFGGGFEFAVVADAGVAEGVEGELGHGVRMGGMESCAKRMF